MFDFGSASFFDALLWSIHGHSQGHGFHHLYNMADHQSIQIGVRWTIEL